MVEHEQGIQGILTLKRLRGNLGKMHLHPTHTCSHIGGRIHLGSELSQKVASSTSQLDLYIEVDHPKHVVSIQDRVGYESIHCRT